MNLHCAHLHLAIASPPPERAAKPSIEPGAWPADEEAAPKAANDNQIIWPLMPFPEDWCASN